MSLVREIKRGFHRAVRGAFDLVTGAGRPQKLNTDGGEAESGYRSEELVRLMREAAADACVLLKNDGVLPLEKSDPVCVLGRCQYDWFCVGYGSGGDVHAPYKVNLLQGLREAGANLYEPLAQKYESLCQSREHRAEHGYWGHWPFSHPEFTGEIKDEWNAAADALTDEDETANYDRAACIVVIGRAAGEDRDDLPQKGSWYLTDAERSLLDMATGCFERVIVVLNTGCLTDLTWLREYGDGISAVLIAWLGGQESGRAVCDVLYGAVSPSGRLPVTAAALEDYPSAKDFGQKDSTRYREGVYVGYRGFDLFAKDRVIFPFGHGLSYAEFGVTAGEVRREADGFSLAVTVKNTGQRPGKHSVPLFVRPPEGAIQKPIRVLCAFGKTRVLAPGEAQELLLRFDKKALASFDENTHEFTLEAGDYYFTVDGKRVARLYLPSRECAERVGPLFMSGERLRETILANLPKELAPSTAKADFSRVLSGEQSAEEFVSVLSVRALEGLTRGHGMMNSPLGPAGNAGVIGGVTKELKALGVPCVSCCDGPAGLRMRAYAALIPCGTALAATFDTELAEALHKELGREMRALSADVRLAPGMDIIRHPLCGRNFEYFSEDPVLSGLTAAAAVRGVQAAGAAACPKHFAFNNQEAWRTVNDSSVSERAAREVYLRNFELCVKYGKPLFIMTSYNKVNGVWAHYHYELVQGVLRGEWGFDGAVMTDWWMRSARSPEFPLLRDNAYRVRAGVDILMPGDMSRLARGYRADASLTESLGSPGGITKAELQQAALHTVRAIARLKAETD